MSKKSIIASILIAIGLLLAVAYKLNLLFWLEPPAKRLNILWREDTQQLIVENKLPKAWYDIGEIEIDPQNAQVAEWLEQYPAPISKKPNGQFKLQVLVLHWLENNEYGVVVQYNLVDRKSQNTVWELGRTYRVGFVY